MAAYTLVTSADQLGQIANEIIEAEAIGLDIETTSLLPFAGEIRLVQLHTQKNIWVIDLFQTKTLGPVADALNSQRTIVIGQNLKFEQKWLLYKFGIELWPIFDTWRASVLIYNGLNLGHNLYDLYRRELGVESDIPDQGKSDWSGVLTQQQLDYAAEDVVHLHALRSALRKKLVDRSLLRVALIEFGVILPEASVENNGLYLDQDKWLDLAQANEIRSKELHQQLIYELPNPKNQIALPGFAPSFNLNSPIQILESLTRLGVQGLENTQEMTLAMHVAEFPLISKLLDYREVSKRLGTYGPDFLEHINKQTGCIHSSFYPFTGAGRYSASDPNTQNVPRELIYRKCFTAPPGEVLIISDYSNIEMRVIAQLSKDKVLIKIFVDDEDAHYRTASILTGKAIADITKKERQEAKPVNFGFCIAEGQRVLTDSGLVPIEEVKDWHKVWDGVEWVSHEGVIDMGVREVIEHDGLVATPDHEVYTHAGSRVFFGDVASSVCNERIAIGAIGTTPIRYDAFNGERGDEGAQSPLRRSLLREMLDDQVGLDGQHSGGSNARLPVSTREVSGQAFRYIGGTLRRDDSALLSGHARLFETVQGPRDPSVVRIEGSVHTLGPRDFSERDFFEEGLRSQRQQRSLRADQSSPNDVFGEQPKQRVLRTYDLLNAGPRHRFTVEGKIVSNCYGMQAPKLVLYAQSSYKVAMSLAKAKDFRKKYFEAYTGIGNWHATLHAELERCKKKGQMYEARTLAGRIRMLNAEEAYNEIVNTPSQGTGADGLKAGMRCVYMRLKKYGGNGMWNNPFKVRMRNHVHDEIMLSAPDSATDKDLQQAAAKDLSEGMCEGIQPMLPDVPVKADAAIGYSWGDKE